MDKLDESLERFKKDGISPCLACGQENYIPISVCHNNRAQFACRSCGLYRVHNWNPEELP